MGNIHSLCVPLLMMKRANASSPAAEGGSSEAPAAGHGSSPVVDEPFVPGIPSGGGTGGGPFDAENGNGPALSEAAPLAGPPSLPFVTAAGCVPSTRARRRLGGAGGDPPEAASGPSPSSLRPSIATGSPQWPSARKLGPEAEAEAGSAGSAEAAAAPLLDLQRLVQVQPAVAAAAAAAAPLSPACAELAATKAALGESLAAVDLFRVSVETLEGGLTDERARLREAEAAAAGLAARVVEAEAGVASEHNAEQSIVLLPDVLQQRIVDLLPSGR